jgi:hypothetical protein
VGWYLKALFQDRRFRIAAAVAAGSFVFIVLALLIGAAWSSNIAMFALFPIFVISTFAIFVVFGIIVRNDYLERSGRR